ncbi:MAG TPA: hypothetical protein VHI51_19035 [Ktedonobacterales bacterium]|jgi:hypothetical protein|nr:hypothetical protein [Ktedonobacterales bacterium]
MATLYQLALYVHILGVLLLFVAVGAESLAVWGMGRAQTVGDMRLWLRSARGPEKLFPLAGALILVAGLYMAIRTWHGTPWVVLGFLGLIGFSVAGAVVNGRRFKAVEKAANAGGAGAIPNAVRRELANPTLRISLWAMSVGALGIVYMMVVKPDWIGSIAALVVASILGALIGALIGQRRSPVAASEERMAAQ